ncbi:MAG: tagaturonate epimerase family protein [Thermoplasmata archaeon]
MSGIVKHFLRIYGKKHLLKVYERSIISKDEATFFMIREGVNKRLIVVYPRSIRSFDVGFEASEEGEFNYRGKSYRFMVCCCNHVNACVLRKKIPFTSPRPAGLKPSGGMGDRIGLATPGHIRAVSEKIFPVLAQQSVRELSRTSRTFNDVLDDVSWAVFQEGYRFGFGADADHLKMIEDVDDAINAGYTMFTVDPSDYVDNNVEEYTVNELKNKFQLLPWKDLNSEAEKFLGFYVGKKVNVGQYSLIIEEKNLVKMAVKYLTAIAFASKVFHHIRSRLKHRVFDFEVSIDETKTPTSPLEHVFIILELRRLGVNITSLSLRFEGKFEKAVDYIGDLAKFKESFKKHVLIAEAFGPYKLSVHSGSDKFSVFPVMGRFGSSLLHLKTAGTSYLEALRIVARHEPNLFREIVKHACERFEIDRKAYDVSTNLSAVPKPDEVLDCRLETTYLDENNARQMLHITYGSILTAKKPSGEWVFRERLINCLLNYEEEYYETIAKHLTKHIKAVWSS